MGRLLHQRVARSSTLSVSCGFFSVQLNSSEKTADGATARKSQILLDGPAGLFRSHVIQYYSKSIGTIARPEDSFRILVITFDFFVNALRAVDFGIEWDCFCSAMMFHMLVVATL